MADNALLKKQFNGEMLALYTKAAKELHYYATRFLQMVNEHGGWETARMLLQSEVFSDGLTRFWEEGRLDLSVEALVLKPEYATLFSFSELDKARKILADLHYTAPWDKPSS